MEQYRIPEELNFENLRLCLDHYIAERIIIRDLGGIREDGRYHMAGRQKVNEVLEGRTLDFRKDSSELYMLIDSEEVFHFHLDDYGIGFFVAYERILPTEDGIGRLVMLTHGVNPYDSTLPKPRVSFLRSVFDHHQMEIFFKGRIELEFHSWWKKPDWKYWTVKKPDE